MLTWVVLLWGSFVGGGYVFSHDQGPDFNDLITTDCRGVGTSGKCDLNYDAHAPKPPYAVSVIAAIKNDGENKCA